MRFLKESIFLFCILLVVSILTACSSKNEEGNSEVNQTEENVKQTRSYKDYIGHEVEIPVSPKKVIYHGENYGDLLPLHVEPIGTSYSWIKDFIFEDKVSNVEEVGFPINTEKVLELHPDLIVIATSDEKTYEQLSKIAPTIVFDTFAPLEERLIELGDIFDKKQEAADWLNAYNKKEEDMWKQLVQDGIIKPGETASVFTYYPGNRLFVMASTGLSQVLYEPGGFKPGEKIQQILDAKTGFEEISLETLPEFAGDHIFILTPQTEEAIQSTKDMMDSSIWQGLPAVKNGNVYTLEIQKSSSDASTRDWLLEEIPSLLKK
jgi:iron complex transport system substrate-binding protein